MKSTLVLRDGGGAGNALLLVPYLLESGEVLIIVETGTVSEARTTEFLSGMSGSRPNSCRMFSCPTVEASTRELEKFGPDVVISSMDSGTLNRDVAKGAALNGIPTYALQDGWGNRLATEWTDAHEWLSGIFVNDPYGGELVTEAWPSFPTGNIIEAGFPHLDRYAGVDPGKFVRERQLAAAELGLNDKKLLFYSGQLWGSGHTLETICAVLKEFKNFRLVVAPHPRLVQGEVPTELKQWMKLVQEYGIASTRNNVQLTYERMLYACDIGISMFSTFSTEASALRKPNMVYQGGAAGEAYREEFPNLKGRWPLAALGCCYRALTAEELGSSLDILSSNPDALRDAQEEHIVVDGHNASRVADIIRERVGALAG